MYVLFTLDMICDIASVIRNVQAISHKLQLPQNFVTLSKMPNNQQKSEMLTLTK